MFKWEKCPECEGTGGGRGPNNCANCLGEGTVPVTTITDQRVEKASYGQRLRSQQNRDRKTK